MCIFGYLVGLHADDSSGDVGRHTQGPGEARWQGPDGGAIVPCVKACAPHAAAAGAPAAVWCAELARFIAGEEVPVEAGGGEVFGVHSAALADGVIAVEADWLFDGGKDARYGEPH